MLNEGFFDRIQKIFKALKLWQKIVLGSIFVILFISLFFIGNVSIQPSKVPLYGMDYNLSEKDVQSIYEYLDGMNIPYTISKDKIFVNDDETAMKIRTELGVKGLTPVGVSSWALFDNQPFTITDFERKVNVRRAITNSIKKHLELLDEIDKADVVISFGEEKYFQDDRDKNPLTASVVITPSSGASITRDKKQIKGIQDLVAKSIDALKSENIVIMDNKGTVLTNKLNETDQELNINLAKSHLEIKEQLRMQYVDELVGQLERVFTKKRFDLKVNLELNWDVEKISENLIVPIVLKEDNPDTPYDDGEVQPSITVSKKETTENFKGQGYIPEGPAGIEDQVPPGLKEKMDRYNSYTKNENIENKEFSRAKKEIQKSPYSIFKVSVSVFLDGVWQKVYDNNGNLIIEKGRIKRKFIPVNEEQVRKVQSILKAYVGFNAGRGDQIAVQAVQFDRSEEFNKEDRLYQNATLRKNIIIYSILGMAVLFVLLIIYRAIEKEVLRRRRLKEEALLREQEAMRLEMEEQAKKKAYNYSPEEEDLINLENEILESIQNETENVARLVKTWLATEEQES